MLRDASQFGSEHASGDVHPGNVPVSLLVWRRTPRTVGSDPGFARVLSQRGRS